MTKLFVATALTGLGFGFCLSRIGFSDYDQVNAMFRLQDFRLIGAFALAVVLLVVAWTVISRSTGAQWSPRKIHRGTVVGAVFFGAGWALCGACPSIAFVQLGELQWGALLTVAGMILGNYIYAVVHERYFRWSTHSCLDD